MRCSEIWDDSNDSALIKYEKHWQKQLSYQTWDIAFLYIAYYQNIIRHFQRTQNTVAGYVPGRYTKESDFIATLGWFPVQEMIEFAVVKCTFLALNNLK